MPVEVDQVGTIVIDTLHTRGEMQVLLPNTADKALALGTMATTHSRGLLERWVNRDRDPTIIKATTAATMRTLTNTRIGRHIVVIVVVVAEAQAQNALKRAQATTAKVVARPTLPPTETETLTTLIRARRQGVCTRTPALYTLLRHRLM